MKQAVAADVEGNTRSALLHYTQSVEYFMPAMKCKRHLKQQCFLPYSSMYTAHCTLCMSWGAVGNPQDHPGMA